MASIQMNMGTETEINATPNKDGLILFDTTNKKIILDNNGTREVLTKHIEANPNLNGAEQLENLKVNGEVLNFLPVDISNVEKDGEEISDILEDKYDTEGDYNTTVDKCTDLTRATPVTDTAPYIYRQTPVKESFKALMKKIVGASVVWNQLVQNGNFVDTSGWDSIRGSFSVSNNVLTYTVNASGTAGIYMKTPQRFSISGHKYLIFITVNTSQTGTFLLGLETGVTVAISEANKDISIKIVQSASVNNSPITCYKLSSSENDTFKISKITAFDLTAMFGTTIADYVNTLETAETGSGIAWLQSYGFFTEDYYAYKNNKLESGCVSAKKIVETNQAKMDNANNPNRSSFSYTKETAQSIVGTKTVGGGNFFAQFEIDLISGKTYTFSFGKFETNGTENANVNVYIYSDRLWGTLIKANWNVSKDGSTWTSTYNGKAYVGIFTTASVDTVLELDGFMASISGSTSFEPYTETTYPISPITLRGLFKLSIDKLTVDGDEYNADGSVTRKFGIVDLGTLDYKHYTTADGEIFRSQNVPTLKTVGGSVLSNILCSKYETVKQFSRHNLCIYTNSPTSNNYVFDIIDNNYTDVQTFKTAMSGVYCIYELSTPTTEQTTPFTETEIVGSTEEFIDYEVAQSNRDVAITVGTETDYYQSYNIPSIPFTDCYLSASNQNLIWVSNS